ncbi:ethanolamine ammonia-lyase subunit EutB, partial [Nocardia gipuzkoensis]
DVMLGYQSLSFHDALYARRVLGLRPAPEFAAWLAGQGMLDAHGHVREIEPHTSPLRALVAHR